MLNNLQKTVCALAVLATTSLPALAESIDVRVIGTISPAACAPTISGGGTIDYGTIKTSALAKDTFTTLAEKQLDFTITCDAPAKIAIKTVSQRGNSAVNQADGKLWNTASSSALFGQTGIPAYGLGLDGDKGIGGYGLRLAAGTMMADGELVDSIQHVGSIDSASVWAKSTTGVLMTNTPSNVLNASWAAAGTTTPLAFTTLAGKLGVQAYINKASELDLTKPVVLDGLTTLELVYL